MSAGHEPDVNFGCSLDGGKTWQPTSAPPSEESEELDAATKKSGMHHLLVRLLAPSSRMVGLDIIVLGSRSCDLATSQRFRTGLARPGARRLPNL
jgi:hypothetical protein